MTKDAALPMLRCFVRVIELGIISGAARDLGMTQPTVSRQFREPLAMLEEVIVCHPSIAQTVVRPKELSALPCTVFSGLEESFAIRLKRRGQTERVKVRPRMFTDQIVARRQALLAGAGAGLIHRYAVNAELQRGHLVRLLADWELQAWRMHTLFTVRTPSQRMQI